jgi:hypothetical protein
MPNGCTFAIKFFWLLGNKSQKTVLLWGNMNYIQREVPENFFDLISLLLIR